MSQSQENEHVSKSMPMPTPIGNGEAATASISKAAVEEAIQALQPEPAIKDRAFFAGKIKFWWGKTLEGILEVGWWLVDAQTTLTKVEWRQFIQKDVPFDHSVLRKLMTVAQDRRLRDPKYRNVLPASWASLYEIALMDQRTFEKALTAGIISRKTPQKVLREFRLKAEAKESLSEDAFKPAGSDESHNDIPVKTSTARETSSLEATDSTALEGDDPHGVGVSEPEPKDTTTKETGHTLTRKPAQPVEPNSEQRVAPISNSIVIFVSPEIANKHVKDLVALMDEISGMMVGRFSFMIDAKIRIEVGK